MRHLFKTFFWQVYQLNGRLVHKWSIWYDPQGNKYVTEKTAKAKMEAWGSEPKEEVKNNDNVEQLEQSEINVKVGTEQLDSGKMEQKKRLLKLKIQKLRNLKEHKDSDGSSIESPIDTVKSKKTNTSTDCDICPKRFSIRKYMLKHRKLIHPRAKEIGVAQFVNFMSKLQQEKCKVDEEASKIIQCDICKKIFTRKDTLTKHNRVLHPGVHDKNLQVKHEPNEDLESETQVVTQSLQHAYKELDIAKVEEKAFKCPTCEKGFNHKNNMITHTKMYCTSRGLRQTKEFIDFSPKIKICSKSSNESSSEYAENIPIKDEGMAESKSEYENVVTPQTIFAKKEPNCIEDNILNIKAAIQSLISSGPAQREKHDFKDTESKIKEETEDSNFFPDCVQSVSSKDTEKELDEIREDTKENIENEEEIQIDEEDNDFFGSISEGNEIKEEYKEMIDTTSEDLRLFSNCIQSVSSKDTTNEVGELQEDRKVENDAEENIENKIEKEIREEGKELFGNIYDELFSDCVQSVALKNTKSEVEELQEDTEYEDDTKEIIENKEEKGEEKEEIIQCVENNQAESKMTEDQEIGREGEMEEKYSDIVEDVDRRNGFDKIMTKQQVETDTKEDDCDKEQSEDEHEMEGNKFDEKEDDDDEIEVVEIIVHSNIGLKSRNLDEQDLEEMELDEEISDDEDVSDYEDDIEFLCKNDYIEGDQSKEKTKKDDCNQKKTSPKKSEIGKIGVTVSQEELEVKAEVENIYNEKEGPKSTNENTNENNAHQFYKADDDVILADLDVNTETENLVETIEPFNNSEEGKDNQEIEDCIANLEKAIAEFEQSIIQESPTVQREKKTQADNQGKENVSQNKLEMREIANNIVQEGLMIKKEYGENINKFVEEAIVVSVQSKEEEDGEILEKIKIRQNGPVVEHGEFVDLIPELEDLDSLLNKYQHIVVKSEPLLDLGELKLESELVEVEDVSGSVQLLALAKPLLERPQLAPHEELELRRLHSEGAHLNSAGDEIPKVPKTPAIPPDLPKALNFTETPAQSWPPISQDQAQICVENQLGPAEIQERFEQSQIQHQPRKQNVLEPTESLGMKQTPNQTQTKTEEPFVEEEINKDMTEPVEKFVQMKRMSIEHCKLCRLPFKKRKQLLEHLKSHKRGEIPLKQQDKKQGQNIKESVVACSKCGESANSIEFEKHIRCDCEKENSKGKNAPVNLEEGGCFKKARLDEEAEDDSSSLTEDIGSSLLENTIVEEAVVTCSICGKSVESNKFERHVINLCVDLRRDEKKDPINPEEDAVGSSKKARFGKEAEDDHVFLTEDAMSCLLQNSAQEVTPDDKEVAEYSRNVIEPVLEEIRKETELDEEIDWEEEIRLEVGDFDLEEDMELEEDASLLVDKDSKENSKTLICSSCDKHFKSKLTLYNHTKAIHDGMCYICTVCDYKGRTRTLLKYHKMSKHTDEEFYCDKCNHTTGSAATLTYHKRKQHNSLIGKDPSELNFCSKCDQRFQSKHGLKIHMCKAHLQDADMQDKSIKTKSKEKPERAENALAMDYEIKTEKIDFTMLSAEEIGLDAEDGNVESLKCPHCFQKPKDSRGLKIHMTRMHSSLRLWDNVRNSENIQKSGMLHIQLPSLQETEMQSAICHIPNVTSETEKGTNSTGEMNFTFLSSEELGLLAEGETLPQLNTQKQNIQERYHCDKCEYTANTKLILYNHKTKEHKSPTLQYDSALAACTLCDQRFRGELGLEFHMNTVHIKSEQLFDNGQKKEFQSDSISNKTGRFRCQICDKEINSELGLNIHTTKMHDNGEGEYPCRQCSQKLGSARNLKEHMETHRKQAKKFECKFCGQVFRGSIVLNSHITRKHK